MIFKTAVLALILAFNTPQAQAEDDAPGADLLALKFYADWCVTCREMGPIFTDLENLNEDNPVAFYKLDFTTNTTKKKSKKKASAMNVRDIVDENDRTGFILLIDLDEEEVVERLTVEDGLKEMNEKVQGNL